MTTIEALIELQEVDGRIRELELEKKDLPRRKALEMARLTGVSLDLKAAQAGKDEVVNRVNSYTNDGLEIDEKIRSLKQAQLAAKSNKEYQDYTAQIELLTKQQDAAINNASAANDFTKSADDRIARAQAEFDAAKGGVDSFCAEIDERMAKVEAELAEAKLERAEKAKAVTSPKFLLHYERVRTKRWPAVVTLTHEGVCDGCHLVQPPNVGQMVDANVRHGEQGEAQEIVACQMCGRLLYRA